MDTATMNWGSFGTIDGWLAIAGLSVGTFLIRYSFIGLLAGKKLPPRIAGALQLAVPAIFAALVIPLVVLTTRGVFDMSQRWPHIVAAMVVGYYAWKRGGLLLPLLLGMGVLHGLLWISARF